MRRKKDEPMPEENKPSLWDRFGEAERDRRIAEFIQAEQDKAHAQYAELPSIQTWHDEKAPCPQCGCQYDRQRIAASPGKYSERRVRVREDGDKLVLYSAWHDRSYARYAYIGFLGDYDPDPVHLFTILGFTRLKVTCECGFPIGDYRPLNPLGVKGA